MRSQAMLAAAALAATTLDPLPAFAAHDDYYGYRGGPAPLSYECRDNRKDNTTKGALLGGAIGAAAGAGAAGRGSRGGGALIGGALGAGIGALAGRKATSCDDFEKARHRNRGGYYDHGYQGASYYGRGGGCYLEDVVRYDRRGRRYTETVEVCR